MPTHPFPLLPCTSTPLSPKENPTLNTPVVRWQHRNYIPLALFSGLVLPALIGYTWGDALGGLVWGGAVARLLIWHTTFCINSLAHWTGLQPYTEEVTARGNYLLALLTSGEGNHNFHHAFPKDFRNGPHPADWDPSKWIIYLLHTYTPFVPTIAITPESAISKARAAVHMSHADRLRAGIPLEERAKSREELPVWSREEAMRRHGEVVVVDEGGEVGGEAGGRGKRERREKRERRRVLVLVEGCLVDVGGYLDEHPGGEHLLLSHCIAPLSPSIDLSIRPLRPLSADESASAFASASASSSSEPSRSTSPTHDSGYSSGTQSPPMASPRRRIRRAPGHVYASDNANKEEDEGLDPNMDQGAEMDNNDNAHEDGKRRGEEETKQPKEVQLRDATRSFFGGMNNHSQAARERMRTLRVAVLKE